MFQHLLLLEQQNANVDSAMSSLRHFVSLFAYDVMNESVLDS